MHSTAKPPTKAEQRRAERARTVGCVACYMLPGSPYSPPDNHHELSGGRRIGHFATAYLCRWHHRGIPLECGMKETEALMGPSMAHNPRRFRARFGSKEFLIALTDQRLEDAEKMVVR